METAVIVPAFNEEKTIKNVLRAAKNTPVVDEIIVVDDGSTDNTALNAEEEGVRVIKLSSNVGKGGAIKAGVKETTANVLILLDADLIGIRPDNVIDLVSPIYNGEADMVLGIFDNGRFSTDLAQKIAPGLTGQRALNRSVLDEISDLDISRYGVEAALNKQAKTGGINVSTVVLKDVSHVMKEEKMGYVKGFLARMKMYWEIMKCVK